MPALPGGTVTFLFTDIEGSARLWEDQPDVMRGALARHDALLRAVIAQHDGQVFKTMGDAFCAAFHTAPDAVNAALAAQQALHTEIWPESVRIRVRMALHTGAAELRDNDYFGRPLNRVARLLSAGHGGQTLISAATQELVRDSLPPPCSLISLGEHRLRDLNRPEVVFQLQHPALPAEFAPLRSLDNPALPNNLPRQLTSFIGREKEIAELTPLLERSSLLTLVGAGGCGKTRLSLQVAAEVLEQFPDGVWFAELAPLATPGLVAQTVASVLGIKEQPGQPLQQTLTDSLKSKHLLLVLDNCEHLLSACAHLVSALLRACPHVKVLATSREPLGISGEQSYRVPSLSLPDPKQPSSPRSVSQYEAVRLFIERAMLARPDFVVTNQNAPALAQLCHHLDGIPLAIELAAARLRSISVEDINIRLDNRFRLLTGGDRMALPRQQTLRALIDWSYDLLNIGEKLLLARLSVFAGGWTVEAAEQVGVGEGTDGGSIEDWEILDLLTGLADKSLVIAEEQQNSTRYRLLETVRQYAVERLQAGGERDQVQDRHRDWLLAFAEEADPQLKGSEQVMWLQRLEREHDNLRAALAWCKVDAQGAEAGLRLAGAWWWFWFVRGHYREGREHLGDALNREGGQASTAARAKALNGAGGLAWAQGDYAGARVWYEESLAIRRELGDRQGVAYALYGLGIVAAQQGDHAGARGLYEEGLVIYRKLEDRHGIALSLHSLSIGMANQGDYAGANALVEESLAIYRELGDRQGIADTLSCQANRANDQGDYAGARALCEESLIIYRELEDRRGMAHSFERLVTALVGQSEAQSAMRLFGAANALREGLGAALSLKQREHYEQQMAQARTALGEQAVAAAFEEGRMMSWQQAAAYALKPRSQR